MSRDLYTRPGPGRVSPCKRDRSRPGPVGYSGRALYLAGLCNSTRCGSPRGVGTRRQPARVHTASALQTRQVASRPGPARHSARTLYLIAPCKTHPAGAPPGARSQHRVGRLNLHLVGHPRGVGTQHSIGLSNLYLVGYPQGGCTPHGLYFHTRSPRDTFCAAERTPSHRNQER